MPASPKILIGGFQHETNTFAPYKTPYSEFVKADGWPGLTLGDDIFSVMTGLNIPISGFIDAAQGSHHQLVPVLWCAAEPASYVTTDAFDRVSDQFIQALGEAGPVDGIYLDLHGAMVVEDFEDGEGEFLRRIRAVVGPDLPIIISLDLHANVTDAMVQHATAMTIFRTYPHLDMSETGARAVKLMDAALTGKTIFKGMYKIPFLIPLTSQCTNLEPAKSIYQQIATTGLASQSFLNAEFATGFPPADIYECGAAVVAYSTDKAELDRQLEHCLNYVLNAEPLFVNELLTPDQAALRAMENQSSKPVVLADTQDNPGAGGTSDTTGLLEALVRNGVSGAVIAVLHDPEAASLAHQAGVGAELDIALAGKSPITGVAPYNSCFQVDALGDGHFIFTGEMYKDSVAQLGPMALLRVMDDNSDVRVIVGSERVQCLDLAIFRHLGVEPTEQKILGVKSSVHFRADFDPIAAETLVVVAPGANPCQHIGLPYQNLRPGIRLEPMGPVAPSADS